MHHISVNQKQEAMLKGTFFSLATKNSLATMAQSKKNITKVIIMSSTTKVELGVLFINAKHAVAIQATLAEMGHPQGPMSISTDNSTAIGVLANYWTKHHSAAYHRAIQPKFISS